MKTSLSAYINEWAQTTTIHAVPNISRARNAIVKVLWLVSLLTSAGWCFFVVITTFWQYYDHEVVTQIKTIYEMPAIFPAVTICNSNAFTTPKSLEYVKKYLKILNFTDFDNIDVLHLYETEIRDPLEEALFLMKQSVQRYIMFNTTDEEKRELGLPLDDVIISCYFNLGNCDMSDFTWSYDFSYGNCYTFNSGKNSRGQSIPLKSNIRGGSDAGLLLGLFTGMVDSIYTLAADKGVHIFIHNQTVQPALIEGVNILSGLRTHIQIERTTREMAPLPFNECQENFEEVPYYQAIKETTFSYRQQDCFFYAYQQKLVKDCGCYDLAYPKLQNSDLGCLTLNQSICLMNTASKVFNPESYVKLSQKCPLQCKSNTITFTTTFLDYPSKAMAEQYAQKDFIKKRFAKVTNQTLDYEMVKENMAFIGIFYEDLFYTFITEKPKMTSLDLISSVGGTLGLFLGCSLLSFIELIEVILTTILIKIETKSAKKPKGQDTRQISKTETSSRR